VGIASTEGQAASQAPRVFISHASEDKGRFVLAFATDLRAAGVNAWVDRWEMLPGDSLVRKIFTEGLDQATAVIVILSRVSIAKPWVTEELDAAVVKRINEDSKLIPVVLDDLDIKTEVPPSVRHLVCEFVRDTNDRAEVVDRVVRSIFGTVERPPLGSAPPYLADVAAAIPGLDRIDASVLRLAGAEAVADYGDRFGTSEFVASTTQGLGVTDAQAIESLEVLEAEGYVQISRTMAQGIEGMRSFALLPLGLEVYLREYVADYPRFEQSLIARIVERSNDQGSEGELAASADVPGMIVRHVLGMLEMNGDLKLSNAGNGPNRRFYNVSPRLRRRAAQ
jgi:hypothetical protein